MKDGQGLEVANADASAIEALDFLREEWLVFGKRFERFVAAADAEQKCALLPALAANLALSVNSVEGRALGVKHLARAHGGEAYVTSEPGAGCEFTVKLPVRETTHSTQEKAMASVP